MTKSAQSYKLYSHQTCEAEKKAVILTTKYGVLLS